MALISDEDRQYLVEKFGSELEKDVRLVFFTNGNVDEPGKECMYCEDTQAILEEVSELSDKIKLEIHNYYEEEELVEEYGIERIPAIAVVSDVDYNIRLYGIPSGYEFGTLIEDIVSVSTGNIELTEKTIEAIKEITEPVTIKVFVTPTCPYCPKAVRTAHMMAMANENIKAEMIEANEYPELSSHYGVYGVPKVVINEDTSFEGALPEAAYLDHVLKAIRS